MAKVLVVTSGKGGVGKTTSTAALGAALAQGGETVVTNGQLQLSNGTKVAPRGPKVGS